MSGIDERQAASLDGYWRELVTASMLGTDRRDPPEAPAGPVADLVADAMRPDAAARMLATVGAVAAARRAAFVPGPVAPALQPPDVQHDAAADDAVRPWCPPAAVAAWRRVIADWPVLEDEWALTVIERGFTLPPDALVELLQRHRTDAVRRSRAMLAGGSVARWLVAHVPDLAATSQCRVSAEAVTSLPDLPMTPELEEMAALDAHTFATRLAAGFEVGAYGPPDRAVLLNLIARCRPAVLLDAAEALERTQVGQALALADMARLRHQMLTTLDPYG